MNIFNKFYAVYKGKVLRFITDINVIKSTDNNITILNYILSRIYYSVINKFSYMVSIPLFFLIIIIRPVKKIKFIQLYGMTIGHYSLNTELMLCSKKAYQSDINTWIIYYHAPVILPTYKKRFFFSIKYPICNKQLYKMWKRNITIFPFYNLLYWTNHHLGRFLGDQYKLDPQRYYEKIGSYRDYDGLLKKEKIHLTFTHSELKIGQKILNKMGIPSGASYICMLVRDAKYYSNRMYGDMSNKTLFRNANIDNYNQSALFLANNGYYVIRMGSVVENSFKIDHPKIIDYANSIFRSDFMDIYLSAHCYFFMSTASGLDNVAFAFRRPILTSNLVLLHQTLQYPVAIFLFKKFLNKNSKKIISLKEMFQLFKDVDYFSIMNKMTEYELELVENSQEEILSATKEMLSLLKNNRKESETYKNLQSLLTEILISNDAYILSSDNSPKCSTSFLLENRDLLF